jgi:hypothetical protein
MKLSKKRLFAIGCGLILLIYGSIGLWKEGNYFLVGAGWGVIFFTVSIKTLKSKT